MLRNSPRDPVEWSEQNQRAFRIDELPPIFRQATGVDIADILSRWMQLPVR